MKLRDFSIKEIGRIIGIYFLWTGWFYGLFIYCLFKIVNGQGLAAFRLGNLPIVMFDNASNIEVAIFSAILVVAVGVGFYLRYITYGEELHFKKTYNIKDERRYSDDMFEAGGSNGDGRD